MQKLIHALTVTGITFAFVVSPAALADKKHSHKHKHGHKHGHKHKGNLAAHTHGTASLELVRDGGTVQLQFRFPASDIVGFEHAAKTSKDKEDIRLARKKFALIENLVLFPKAAVCEPVAQETQFVAEDNHGEFTVEFAVDCEEPKELKQATMQVFKSFPRVKKVSMTAVLGDRQLKKTFTAKNTDMPLQ